MRRTILRTPVIWLKMFLAGCLLWGLGCGAAETPLPADITYTSDGNTQKLISLLAQESKDNAYRRFEANKHFLGVFVPSSLFSLDPFVLGFSTESVIPTILLLEAHWVKRYGESGWLLGLEGSQVKFAREELVPAVAEAFSVAPADTSRRKRKELMAVPTSIRGNILFFRRDLLARFRLTPPRNWDELKAICRKILPQEKHLKYGLLLHPNRFIDDFYPIFWGCGGHVMEGDQMVLAQAQNQAAFLAALKEIQGMQGTILPAARDMKQFEPEGALQRSFLNGEVLFMINRSIHLKGLGASLLQEKGKAGGGLTTINQVGVAPIPSQVGHTRRYTNLDSLGWAVNDFAAKSWNAPQVMEGVEQFLKLVANERIQLQAAETWGEVPSLRSALGKVKNKEVLQVYNDTFAVADLVMQVRPHSQRVNMVLEKYLKQVLYGQRTPEGALQVVLQELK